MTQITKCKNLKQNWLSWPVDSWSCLTSHSLQFPWGGCKAVSPTSANPQSCCCSVSALAARAVDWSVAMLWVLCCRHVRFRVWFFCNTRFDYIYWFLPFLSSGGRPGTGFGTLANIRRNGRGSPESASVKRSASIERMPIWKPTETNGSRKL